MKQTIHMIGKSIELELSRAAEKQMAIQQDKVCVEMELYFSCLLRKQVNIKEKIDSDFSVIVSDRLELGFRPVMTQSCSVASCEGAPPPVSDFPIVKPERYVPHWVKLDYRKGQWTGEFGYQDQEH